MRLIDDAELLAFANTGFAADESFHAGGELALLQRQPEGAAEQAHAHECDFLPVRIVSLGLGVADASLAHPLEDYFGDLGLVANAGGIPEALAFFLSGIAPGGLAGAETLTNGFFGLAEHYGDVFVGMEAVADEEEIGGRRVGKECRTQW